MSLGVGADTWEVTRVGVWLRAVGLAALALAVLAFAWGLRGSESAYCSDFRRIDGALQPLREAKAQGDFESVPSLVNAVADTYEGIEPPAALREDWATAVEFFRVQAASARAILRRETSTTPSAVADARYGRAFTHITDYTIARCGGTRGQLVP